MKIRPASIIAILTVGVVALSSCGRGDSGPGAQQTGQAISTGKASGSITIWAMGAEGEKLGQLAKDFEALNPGTTIAVTPIPWDAAHDKFTTAISSNSAPDAAMVGTTWMGEFVGLNALDPTPPSIDASGFFQGAEKTTQVGSTSYGIPWYVETRLVYYRKDLAAKAGISQPPKDWEGLKSMAKAMQTGAGAKWGIGFQPGGKGSWETVLPFAWSNGAKLMSDSKTFSFDTPEMVEAVKYYQSFFTDGIADKAPTEGQTEAAFASGSTPMFVSGPWMMSAVEKVGGPGFKDRYDVMQMPTKKTSTSFVGGSDFVVFKSSKNRDTAWKFVQFLTDPKTQVKWYQLSSDLPSVTSAWKDPALAGDTKLATFGKQLESAQAPPSIATWEQVASKFDSEIEKVTKSAADPAEAMRTVQAQVKSIGTGG